MSSLQQFETNELICRRTADEIRFNTVSTWLGSKGRAGAFDLSTLNTTVAEPDPINNQRLLTSIPMLRNIA
jgi:hypothetical protein